MTRAPDTLEPFDPGDGDPLDAVVATCLESAADDLETAIERACRAHPDSADEIRRRIERLRRIGLVRPPGVDGDERFPERLGEFRLLERLGGGGMGVVFRARQETLGREVALKLIRPEHLYFPRARERFRRETEAAARLQHPGLVPIYAVGEENGIPYFAMELVRGATLGEVLGELRARPPEGLRGRDVAQALDRCMPAWVRARAPAATEAEARAFDVSYVEMVLRLVIQVADALQHAHARGVLHRDVKPSNVALTPDGRALLFDFGLAILDDVQGRMTQTRAEIGSLYYMSPEQIRGERDAIDRRTDVYSLGVSLYELLALRLPFADPDATAARRAITEGEARPLRALNRGVSRDLAVVCAKAMERDAARRYPDAAAFARDLRNVLEKRPIDARPAGVPLRARRWVQRHPAASAALAIALAAPTGLYWRESVHARSLGTALAEVEAQRAAADREAGDARAINTFLIELFSAADPSLARGREYTARELLDVGASRLETELADQPLARARLLDAIGDSYASLGVWDSAESALHRALELRTAAAGAESLEVADSLSALAMLERQLGRPDAPEHARRAVELRRALSSEPNFEIAESLVGLGLCLSDESRFDESIRAFEDALEVIGRIAGDQRRLRAEVLTNVAFAREAKGDHEGALTVGREALDQLRSIDGRPNAAIAACLNTLGLALTALARYDEARPIYDELLEIERQLTGEESVRFATFVVSKSNVDVATGRLSEGIALLERAAGIFDRTAPPALDNAVRCQEKLAAAYVRAARWSDALDFLRAFAARIESESLPGEWRALMVSTLIARCHEALGDSAEAESRLLAALERASEVRDTVDDGWEAMASAVLSRLLARRGDVDGARHRLGQARALRDDSKLTTAAAAWTRLAAGVLARDAGDVQGARAELEPLAGLDGGPNFGEAAPAIARAELAAAIASSEPGRARELAVRASVELEGLLGASHPETRRAARLLESLP